MHAWYYGMYNVCITSKCHKNIQLLGEKPQSSFLTHNTTECRQHSVVMATELVQPPDLACGTLYQSSCVIPTSSSDCSDDSWRDTFFPDAWTRHSVTSDMRRHRKKHSLTYLLKKTWGQNWTYTEWEWNDSMSVDNVAWLVKESIRTKLLRLVPVIRVHVSTV